LFCISGYFFKTKIEAIKKQNQRFTKTVIFYFVVVLIMSPYNQTNKK